MANIITCEPRWLMLYTGLGRYPFWLLWLLVPLAAILLLAHAFLGAPILADRLNVQVFAEGLDEVSALAFADNNDLYATLEKRHGKGELVRIRYGHTSTLLDNLDKPDGILRLGNRIYITNEAGIHGLGVYESGVLHYIDGVSGAEGISSTSDGKILIIEDRKQEGRLLEFDPATNKFKTLLGGLNEAEGVCQAPGGDIYYVEKTSDSLSRYSNGQVSIAASGLENPAFLNCLDDGSILITEDRTNFGRLLRYRNGTVEVLATHLRSPQSVIIGSDGAYYLAEQRKGRILRINAS